ncbi:hypothetical protein I8H84_05465 [Candidatus Saccharibacteria bacterium]|nr:hypothetical protein [Candidatus Saccharibacteria bacterium]MBH1973215.1 hypothetical protein [Candidatus Saccharibacteria bacterium]MBH1990544.1 hypothetical protein [Candidatus Saccharibacteria bacterium]
MDTLQLYIKTRTASFWRVLVIAFLFCGVILYLYLSFTFVIFKITLHDSIEGDAQLTVSDKLGSSKIASIGDVSIIPRASESVSATVGNYSSSTFTSLNPILNSISIDIYKDKGAQKYTRSQGLSIDCSTYDESKDILLSYNCTAGGALYTYATSDKDSIYANRRVATTPANATGSPYLGGVIGISVSEKTEPLFYTSGDGRTTYYPLPSDIDLANIGFSQVITDSITTSSKSFAITTRSGDIYIATLDQGEIKYIKYPHSEGYDSKSDTTICALSSLKLLCYYGPFRNSANSKLKKEFVTLSIESPDKISFIKKSLSSDVFPENIYTDKSGAMYVNEGKNLYELITSDKEATSRPVARNVTYVTSGNDIYYIQNSSVYKINSSSQQAYMIFKSSHILPTAISTFSSTIFINALVNGAGPAVHKYKLDDTVNDAPNKRLIDILPLQFNDSGDVSDSDLVKDRVFIRIKAPVTKERGSKNDDETFNRLKSDVENILQQKGLDTSSLDVSYSY